jgi:hypothetical protein
VSGTYFIGTMASTIAITFGVLSFIGVVFSAVTMGIGWTILHGSDICTTSMYTYIQAVTITATVHLAFYGLSFFISLASLCGETIATIAFVYNIVVFTFLIIVGALLNLAWFIWGIVVLANHEFEGTIYNNMSIVFVVISGIGVVGNTCHGLSNSGSSTKM